MIEVVEFTERIEAILPRLDEMIGGGLVTLEKVRVILYRSAQRSNAAFARKHRKSIRRISRCLRRQCSPRARRLSEQKAKPSRSDVAGRAAPE